MRRRCVARMRSSLTRMEAVNGARCRFCALAPRSPVRSGSTQTERTFEFAIEVYAFRVAFVLLLTRRLARSV